MSLINILMDKTLVKHTVYLFVTSRCVYQAALCFSQAYPV